MKVPVRKFTFQCSRYLHNMRLVYRTVSHSGVCTRSGVPLLNCGLSLLPARLCCLVTSRRPAAFRVSPRSAICAGRLGASTHTHASLQSLFENPSPTHDLQPNQPIRVRQQKRRLHLFSTHQPLTARAAKESPTRKDFLQKWIGALCSSITPT